MNCTPDMLNRYSFFKNPVQRIHMKIATAFKYW